MKVHELKAILAELPDNMEIVMAKDGEGNSYSPLSDVDKTAVYVPESTWSGDVYSSDWSAEDAGFDEPDEWERLKAGPKTLVLWPTN